MNYELIVYIVKDTISIQTEDSFILKTFLY